MARRMSVLLGFLTGLVATAVLADPSAPRVDADEKARWLLERRDFRFHASLCNKRGASSREEVCLVNEGGRNVLLGDWTGEGTGDVFGLQFYGAGRNLAADAVRVEGPPDWLWKLKISRGHLVLELRPGVPFMRVAASERVCFHVTGAGLTRSPLVIVDMKSWIPR